MHHRGELVFHGAVWIAGFDFVRDHHHEIQHPFFPFGLESAPCGIIPVNDRRNVAAMLRFPTRLAGIAIARACPEKHVQKNAFNREQIEDFI